MILALWGSATGSVFCDEYVPGNCNLSRWTPFSLAIFNALGSLGTWFVVITALFRRLRRVCSPQGPKLDADLSPGPSFASTDAL